jgi:hypothetical protein
VSGAERTPLGPAAAISRTDLDAPGGGLASLAAHLVVMVGAPADDGKGAVTRNVATALP